MNNATTVRGFITFLWVAFMNAFVDLGHKIVVQNTLFKTLSDHQQVLMTAIVNALILLPFVLLFTPSGFLSDRYSKTRVMKISALFAVLITLMITLCYYRGWFHAAFTLTFILAVQSALYSPAKYGYIRELVGAERLSSGNAWVQAVSMIAILAGSAVFSALFELKLSPDTPAQPDAILQDIAPLGWLLVIGSVIECLLAFRLPGQTRLQGHTPQYGDQHQARVPAFAWKEYVQGKTLSQNLRLLFREKAIWQSVIGLTLFLSISQVMIAAFPAYAKSHLGMENTFIIQSIIAMAIIGMMIGSSFASKHSVNHINLALIPAGALTVCAGLFFLPQVSSNILLGCIFLTIGVGGAFMLVPLNALIQFHAKEEQIGKVLAGNNFIQNVGMLLCLALTVAFTTLKLDVSYILWGLFGLSALVALLAVILLPEVLVRSVMSKLIGRKYRLKVLGFNNLPEGGQGTLLLGNHISWLDWAIVQMASPRRVHFVMDRTIYQRWYLKWLFDLFQVIPIAPGQSREALNKITALLNQGELVCLFPEGRISHLGQLGEFKKGFERACEQANGVIIPFYLRGMWGSFFSRSSKRLAKARKTGMKRDVIIAFGQAMDIHSTATQVKQKVFDMSVATWNEYANTLDTLPEAWISTAKARPSQWAVADSHGKPVTHSQFLVGSLLLKRQIQQLPGQNLGLLVPTSSAGLMSNLATMMAGKTVVNLNYTASLEALRNAKENAAIQSIVTSRRFITKLEKRGIDCQTILSGCQICYLEDFKENLSRAAKVVMLLAVKCLPARWINRLLCRQQQREDTAAILFSSGSEGAPKGVMLSHKNILANLRQVSDVLNIRDNDKIMATLPLFHAFGLTVTGMLPLIEGIPVICHPDPTDSLNIARAVAKYEATLMCATSTFLGMYQRNRRVNPMMFSSLRAVVSGAEKLDSKIKAGFQQKFMVPVLEGYGTTETTPVASVNLPGHLVRTEGFIQEAAREGTVGLALPGTTFKIVDPVTLAPLPAGEDGLILIGGAQIMQGYLNDPEKTDEVVVRIDGQRWYKTGDKGHLDDDGYLTIVDRYSRFAKLGGEMVSLGAVEQYARELLDQPESGLVAINLPDEKKGEQIVMLVDQSLEPGEVKKLLMQKGMPSLMLPNKIMQVANIPLLGSGKLDFSTAKNLALAQMG
ncbi:acyl-[ACP]--phospholipid O-acyltransferase [Vibrio mangrovi]|uniref:Acyl-[ACP]--phospholipid O-acyltransferase n=1 Tax=Vibrio mangrovi TaxID=474394 RepID=A0A1Y6IT44_9VIBR|nr:acyl-[ACP]--phospholipid O-acyltransferase [Vibrio mangrovi]MDW6004539.1 acyl-[ACP]--phospholipid O-acyltransferase [Vibrio mangrovi]SMS00827.1 Bifunctional protein Aas [Vibrio mangrovi]